MTTLAKRSTPSGSAKTKAPTTMKRSRTTTIPKEERDWLTMNEAAAEVGITPSGILFAIKKGWIPGAEIDKPSHQWRLPLDGVIEYQIKHTKNLSLPLIQAQKQGATEETPREGEAEAEAEVYPELSPEMEPEQEQEQEPVEEEVLPSTGTALVSITPDLVPVPIALPSLSLQEETVDETLRCHREGCGRVFTNDWEYMILPFIEAGHKRFYPVCADGRCDPDSPIKAHIDELQAHLRVAQGQLAETRTTLDRQTRRADACLAGLERTALSILQLIQEQGQIQGQIQGQGREDDEVHNG